MKLNKLRTVLTAVTVAAVAGVVALAIPANGAGTADNRFITVTGVGTVSVVPDAVRFNATVSSVGSTNAAALSTASKSAAAVRAALVRLHLLLRRLLLRLGLCEVCLVSWVKYLLLSVIGVN